jgi:hypothetical protein
MRGCGSSRNLCHHSVCFDLKSIFLTPGQDGRTPQSPRATAGCTALLGAAVGGCARPGADLEADVPRSGRYWSAAAGAAHCRPLSRALGRRPCAHSPRAREHTNWRAETARNAAAFATRRASGRPAPCHPAPHKIGHASEPGTYGNGGVGCRRGACRGQRTRSRRRLAHAGVHHAPPRAWSRARRVCDAIARSPRPRTPSIFASALNPGGGSAGAQEVGSCCGMRLDGASPNKTPGCTDFPQSPASPPEKSWRPRIASHSRSLTQSRLPRRGRSARAGRGAGLDGGCGAGYVGRRGAT